ncbi:CaiB/BaiF CoA-transferase family protein [Paracoccus sp. S-4012]|uniref:CaiB/BaiF CoA transferase family protein n=1 Tax=Paracoccus sp. S-4012 TaxID=2665648 RepID=UPI00272A2C54|nr:CaiB/BaiF CoA-transferase family protein [Paracoccus sp. S-4012]
MQVVELAGLGPAPLAGQLLADLGAAVTVIDRASAAQDSTDVNRRGKRSIALNLKADAGRAMALRLIANADALIEGFRPGVMEKLRLGPADCHAVNPRLIFTRITGWGQDGPLARRAGHDLTYLALSGALAAIGPEAGQPVPPLNLVADYGGGTMFALFGLLAALHERQISGRGQVVDAAMLDGVVAMTGIFHAFAASGEWTSQRASNLLDGGAPFYRCYGTRDGKSVAFAALEPQFFAEFCRIAGLDPAWTGRQYDRAQWPALGALLERLFASRDRDEWDRLFADSDACVAPVLTFDEVAAYPHNAARGLLVEGGDMAQPAPAPRFSRTPAAPPPAPGAAGQDRDALLAELGSTAEQIGALVDEGTLT